MLGSPGPLEALHADDSSFLLMQVCLQNTAWANAMYTTRVALWL